MDEGEGVVGDADNFFTLYLSVNNNRSDPSSSHGPSCLRPDCGGGRLFSCRRTEVNAALAILKHVVRTPRERTGCGWGLPRHLNRLPVGGLGAKLLRISAAIGSANAISPSRYYPQYEVHPLRRVPRAKPREGESRANQSGRTIYVARPVNPRE